MITHHNVDQVGDGVDERPGPALAVGLRVDGAGQTPRALLGVHLHKMKGPKQVLRAATLWEKGVPLEQLPKINSRAGNRFFFSGKSALDTCDVQVYMGFASPHPSICYFDLQRLWYMQDFVS